ncbi:MAG: Helix-turn-helix domain [Herbinix sp.]|nr:Helix-turn-helix domain [Herbinix sp.]
MVFDAVTTGNRAYTVRVSKNISQDEISAHLGIHQTTYSKFERGMHDMPVSKIIKLCDYYEISLSWLVGDKDMSLTMDEEAEVERYKQFLVSKRK